MADKKMYILRGVADTGGDTYPDEKGNPIKWPVGALHKQAAEDYAAFKGYKPIVLDVSGKADQGTTGKQTEQTKEALKKFLGALEDPDKPDTAFYGFSGGGYNIYWILHSLADNNPDALHRIDLIVVFGAPKTASSEYDYAKYNNLAKKNTKDDPKKWKDLRWDLVYRKNPTKKGLAKALGEALMKEVLDNWQNAKAKDKDKEFYTHMFGPEVLLAEAKEKGAKAEDYWEK